MNEPCGSVYKVGKCRLSTRGEKTPFKEFGNFVWTTQRWDDTLEGPKMNRKAKEHFLGQEIDRFESMAT